VSRETSILVVAGLLFVAVLVAVGLGLSATKRTTTSSGQAVTDPPSQGSSGVVYGLQETPGLSIVGLRLRSSVYVAQVGFVVPPECISTDESGTEQLLAAGICADLPAHGELSGGGTTPAGEKLAIVRVEVSKRCYEALEVGASWPAVAEACGEELAR
jgi:hypothetical protein